MSKLIREEGHADWLRLYVGRVFRIGPVYLVVVTVMLLTVFAHSHFHAEVGPLPLARQMTRWLALGIWTGPHDVNGYLNADILLAGVTWSIHYEWMFYFCLPVLALACKRRRRHLIFAAAALSVCLIAILLHPSNSFEPNLPVAAAEFCLGILSASLVNQGMGATMRNTLSSACVLVLCTTYFFGNPYSIAPVLCAGIAFYLIVFGS